MKIGVIGAGSWGTALSVLLERKGMEVTVTGRNRDHLKAMKKERENRKYLPGVTLGEGIFFVYTMEEAVKDAEIVMFSVPAQTFRENFSKCLPYLADDAVIVNVAKGIEQGSLKRLSEIASELKPGVKYAVLSGPSHAEEVGKMLPTTVTVASEDEDVAKKVQEVFMTDRFRVYTNRDVIGTELGGALKNIMALGAGISDGYGFGDNAKAALMTRGLAEITRLGLAMGAKAETFAGLAGIGDLIVTCTSMHSRNRRCGILIGNGIKPAEAVKEIGMVVEGIYTASAAGALADKYGVEMPITETLNLCIEEMITAADAITRLMGRSPKSEGHESYGM